MGAVETSEKFHSIELNGLRVELEQFGLMLPQESQLARFRKIVGEL
jgi:hypothetical protein